MTSLDFTTTCVLERLAQKGTKVSKSRLLEEMSYREHSYRHELNTVIQLVKANHNPLLALVAKQ